MDLRDYSMRYCVVGAGAAGLAAAKNLKESRIPFDVIEREDDIGGNWYYGKPCSNIYRSVHMITSKQFTQFPDFPMPDDYPTYPGYERALAYLRSYARTFKLYDHIEFNRSIDKIEPVEAGRFWDVTLDNGERRRYRGVVICNGHLRDAKFPTYPGRFSGKVLHSSEYKTPDVLRDKRVLVVGGGNSGCDIAVESSRNADRTIYSTRRGYYYWPKYLFGMPSDEWAEYPLKLRLPVSLRRLFGKWIIKMFSTGDPGQYGLPDPDHKMFESHFIINSQLLYSMGQGDIVAKPDIEELSGDHVRFKDGSKEAIDVIVYATGYNTTFPFIDQKHLNWNGMSPSLYMKAFHPEHDNLFVLGLFQTSTGNWPLMDYQSQVMSRFIYAQDHAPKKAAAFRKMKAGPMPDLSGGIRFTDSTRHSLECEHFVYRSHLKKLIKMLDVGLPLSQEKEVREPVWVPRVERGSAKTGNLREPEQSQSV